MQECDFLVIGSGIAGLSFALEAASLGSVVVMSKKAADETNTRYAQGGIASVQSPLDSVESHLRDTLIAGAGLVDEKVARIVVEEGPGRIAQLVEWGACFDKADGEEDFELGREGGHSQRRILHSRDSTGAEIQRAVLTAVRESRNIEILEEHHLIDLIYEGELGSRVVTGAYILNAKTGDIDSWGARATILATGGAGKVYLYTSNSDVATGDGIAAAYRAGARVGNLEFVQFHPTCLYHLRAKSFLITEAMRGEGAYLLDQDGNRFMQGEHELGELAPRDIVARAIDRQMKKDGSSFVYLDISHRDSGFIKSRFPKIYETTKRYGFDITQGPIPVVPAAHYTCGGVYCDINGRTDLDGLYVTGESACTGLHGANRLASNSLLEALVISHRAFLDLQGRFSELSRPKGLPDWDHLDTTSSAERVLLSHNWDALRRVMWNLVGIVRSDERLALAKERVEILRVETKRYYWNYRVDPDLLELRNIIRIARLTIDCAMMRRESRGLHYNIDCPSIDNKQWRRNTVLVRR